MDGCCRHVATALFEILEFQNDTNNKSATSGPCQWVRKAKSTEIAVPVAQLKTSLTSLVRYESMTFILLTLVSILQVV